MNTLLKTGFSKKKFAIKKNQAMHKIIANINSKGKGFFALEIDNKTIGQIKVQLNNNELILLDTIVPVKRYLYTIRNFLLQAVVEFARMHELKIITLSKFTQQQFSSNPLIYVDVWEKA